MAKKVVRRPRLDAPITAKRPCNTCGFPTYRPTVQRKEDVICIECWRRGAKRGA